MIISLSSQREAGTCVLEELSSREPAIVKYREPCPANAAPGGRPSKREPSISVTDFGITNLPSAGKDVATLAASRSNFDSGSKMISFRTEQKLKHDTPRLVTEAGIII
jgi:hypothetical protein